MSNANRGNGGGGGGGQGKSPAQPPAKDPQRPVHEVRLGRIKAAVWLNETEQGVRYSVSVCRLYKDADGKWQTAESFGRDDLLVLAKVLDRAHTWIADATQGDAPF